MIRKYFISIKKLKAKSQVHISITEHFGGHTNQQT